MTLQRFHCALCVLETILCVYLRVFSYFGLDLDFWTMNRQKANLGGGSLRLRPRGINTWQVNLWMHNVHVESPWADTHKWTFRKLWQYLCFYWYFSIIVSHHRAIFLLFFNRTLFSLCPAWELPLLCKCLVWTPWTGFIVCAVCPLCATPVDECWITARMAVKWGWAEPQANKRRRTQPRTFDGKMLRM